MQKTREDKYGISLGFTWSEMQKILNALAEFYKANEMNPAFSKEKQVISCLLNLLKEADDRRLGILTRRKGYDENS